MTRLTRFQNLTLGGLVLACMAIAVVGLWAIAARQGIGSRTVAFTASFPDAHDIGPGTPVRIRGVEAGQVTAVEYSELDGPEARVVVHLNLSESFANRIFANGTARIRANGLLGSKVISIEPGTPLAGALQSRDIPTLPTLELTDAAAKLTAVANEADLLLKELRAGKGSAGKLLTDDGLYRDLTDLAKDARGAVQSLKGEADKVDRFVADGRDTLRSVKQGTDAIAKLPIVRGYVEDATAILVRPTHRKEAFAFNTIDLFESDSAILSSAGREHLTNLAAIIRDSASAKTDVVIVTQHDPNDGRQTSASAHELTRKRSEVAAEFLKQQKAHRISWVSSRTVTALGLGTNPSPVVPERPLPPSHLQVILFTPG